ncbi:MAG TPA: D-alanine--D-alanine ligase family protein [Steroidobacteraceae bacterium]|nr:D-alanine--D-alanine ligase family protein [Steroidobacteraceae bacterium]
MSKIRVAIVFGGKSAEHEISIVSAMSVYEALDKAKYDVELIGIDKNGRWTLPDLQWLLAQRARPREIMLDQVPYTIALHPGQSSGSLQVEEGIHGRTLRLQNTGVDGLLAPVDIVIPILHGANGEDGTIQGMLELAGLPYVGCGVLGSALCMDKDMAKRVLRDAGLPIVPFITVRKASWAKEPDQIISEAERSFGYPYFVKPANAGSSVGVNKIKSIDHAQEKINDSFNYDSKVLIEKAIDARELEVAILGNDDPSASIVGEVIPRKEFYSYEAKYLDNQGARLEIPAKRLSKSQTNEIREIAINAFIALECSGMARVDFFIDRKSGELFINELNTIPGFTPTSMYPKLWGASGVSYTQLLDRLVELSFEIGNGKSKIKTHFAC